MTASSLMPFSFESREIRVVSIDGQLWFVGKDVAEALGYKDPTTAIRSHCRGVQTLHPIIDSLGRTQEVRIINEPDMYRLVVGSSLPEAVRFERWVFEDVLPSIRKTGSYVAPSQSSFSQHESALRLVPAAVAAANAFFDGNMAKLSANQYVKTATGIDVLSGMGQTHLISEKQALHYTPTEIGKMMNPPLSAVKVNVALAAVGLQEKIAGRWSPTEAGWPHAMVMDTQKRHHNGAPVEQIKWAADVISILCCEETV